MPLIDDVFDILLDGSREVGHDDNIEASYLPTGDDLLLEVGLRELISLGIESNGYASPLLVTNVECLRNTGLDVDVTEIDLNGTGVYLLEHLG
jgi:hypothetical protein